MKQICRLFLRRSVILCAAFALLLTLGMAGQAQAAGTAASTITDPCAGGATGAWQTSVNQKLSDTAQDRVVASNAVLGLFGSVDASLAACYTTLIGNLTTLGALVNPINIIWNAIQQQVISMVNQLCSMVMSDISQLKQFVLNQMCIPLPNLNLNLGLSGFHLNSNCQGIRLFNGMASGIGPVIHDPRSVFPQATGP